MSKVRGSIAVPILLSLVFAVGFTLTTYVFIAPITNFRSLTHASVEETYSSETFPEPVAVINRKSTFGDLLSRDAVNLVPSPRPRIKATILPQVTPRPAKNIIAPSPIVLITATPVPLPASRIKEWVTTEYYDISGTTEGELRQDLDAHGYVYTDGETYDGHTKWQIGWQYWYKEASDSCSVGAVEVNVEAIIVLPKWQNQGDGTASLSVKWDEYIEKLTMHENGHRDIVLSGGKEIYTALLGTSPRPTCDEVKTAVTDTGKGIMEKITTQNETYDEETKHGETQGAVFP